MGYFSVWDWLTATKQSDCIIDRHFCAVSLWQRCAVCFWKAARPREAGETDCTLRLGGTDTHKHVQRQCVLVKF